MQKFFEINIWTKCLIYAFLSLKILQSLQVGSSFSKIDSWTIVSCWHSMSWLLSHNDNDNYRYSHDNRDSSSNGIDVHEIFMAKSRVRLLLSRIGTLICLLNCLILLVKVCSSFFWIFFLHSLPSLFSMKSSYLHQDHYLIISTIKMLLSAWVCYSNFCRPLVKNTEIKLIFLSGVI